MTERADKRETAALGALVFAAVAPLAYVTQRVYERARYGTVDPSLILQSTHVDYLWRIAIATWWAGACAIVVALLFRNRSTEARSRAGRRIGIAALAFAALAVVLAWSSP
jgi:hypothetical protein